MNKKISAEGGSSKGGKQNKGKDTSSEEQRFGVFVEHMDGKFEKVFEGYSVLNNKIEHLDQKVSQIDQKVDRIEYKVESQISELKIDTNSSFKTVMEHFVGIEEDLKSIKRVEDLERRFNLLEMKLKEKHFV